MKNNLLSFEDEEAESAPVLSKFRARKKKMVSMHEAMNAEALNAP